MGLIVHFVLPFGYVEYSHWGSEDIIFIYRFYIAPEYRGQGKFKELFYRFTSMFHNTTFLLEVGTSQGLGEELFLIKLYKKYGFKECEGLMAWNKLD